MSTYAILNSSNVQQGNSFNDTGSLSNGLPVYFNGTYYLYNINIVSAPGLESYPPTINKAWIISETSEILSMYGMFFHGDFTTSDISPTTVIAFRLTNSQNDIAGDYLIRGGETGHGAEIAYSYMKIGEVAESNSSSSSGSSSGGTNPPETSSSSSSSESSSSDIIGVVAYNGYLTWPAKGIYNLSLCRI